jgi:hypothetical protein
VLIDYIVSDDDHRSRSDLSLDFAPTFKSSKSTAKFFFGVQAIDVSDVPVFNPLSEQAYAFIHGIVITNVYIHQKRTSLLAGEGRFFTAFMQLQIAYCTFPSARQ